MKTAELLAETTPRRGGSVATLRTRLARWATRWHWRARVELFELHQDRARLEARERTRREMDERHLAASQAVMWAVIARLRGIDGESARIDRLDPNDIEKAGQSSPASSRSPGASNG